MTSSGYRRAMMIGASIALVVAQKDVFGQMARPPAVRPGSGREAPPPARIAGLPPLSPENQREMDLYMPLSGFRQFPADVRRLMQRETFEYGYCRSLIGRDGPDGILAMRGCNGSHRALVALEQKGWCWGGGWVTADDHWLRCARNPRYVPGSVAEEGDPFSAKDFAEAIAERKADALAAAKRRAALQPR